MEAPVILDLNRKTGGRIVINMMHVISIEPASNGGTIILYVGGSIVVSNSLNSILAQIPEEWGKK